LLGKLEAQAVMGLSGFGARKRSRGSGSQSAARQGHRLPAVAEPHERQSAFAAGSIAEALYKRSVSAPLAPGTNSASAPAEMNIKDLKVLGYDRLIAGLASCFATRRPELIHQLLTSSQPGSEREQEMVTSMAASFAPCLPRNIKLNVPSAELRLAFAEAAYLRLPAPVPGR
jgi:hypothetical protein